MKSALETVLLRMEKSPKRILSTFTNGCSMFRSVKMVSFLLVIFQHQFYLGLPERCEIADFFTPACEAPPDNATELSSRTCSVSGLLELLRSLVYQDFCSTALATSLYALIVHQSA
ncbi:BnaC09g21980D [Brassica napus]|uniref:BnaC09g21980D protein n=1 Tax=Brassica napus TaxID=3708 RepID=A0A078H6Q2_BRANA|nr:BnaC09g21980D [Brassica napus]